MSHSVTPSLKDENSCRAPRTQQDSPPPPAAASALHSFHTRGPSAASEDLAASEESDPHETIEKRHAPHSRSRRIRKPLPPACHGHLIEEIPNRCRRLIVIKIPFVFLHSTERRGPMRLSIPTHRPHIGINEVSMVVVAQTVPVAASPSSSYSAILAQCFAGREAMYQS